MNRAGSAATDDVRIALEPGQIVGEGLLEPEARPVAGGAQPVDLEAGAVAGAIEFDVGRLTVAGDAPAHAGQVAGQPLTPRGDSPAPPWATL